MMWFERWARRQFHISYLLAWLAAGICGGLVLVPLSGLSVGFGWLSVALALGLAGWRRRNLVAIAAVACAGMLIGAERASRFLAATEPYRQYVGVQRTVEGRVLADPSRTRNDAWRLEIGDISIDDDSLPGDIFVTTEAGAALQRGDEVRLSGKLREGFGGYQASLSDATVLEARRGADAVRDVRQGFAAAVRASVEEPAASLGLGFVVGQRSALPTELDDQLRMVGLTHIVVASGYNLTILVRFARRILAGVSRYLATVSSLSLMCGFAVFSGFSPSMNRAVAVTGLSIVAWHVGRRFHPLQLILYVAAGTSYWKPVYIWGDIGWYLSFLAFAGVLIVAPVASRLLFREREAPALAQLVIETVAAQWLTLPVILLVFGQLPTLSLIANALVAPVIPAAMVATTVAGVVTWLLPAVGPVAGWSAELTIGYVLAIVDWLSMVPGAQAEVRIGPVATGVAYALTVAGIAAAAWRLRISYRARSVVE